MKVYALTYATGTWLVEADTEAEAVAKDNDASVAACGEPNGPVVSSEVVTNSVVLAAVTVFGISKVWKMNTDWLANAYAADGSRVTIAI